MLSEALLGRVVHNFAMPDRPAAVVADDAVDQREVALAVRSRRRMLQALRSAGRPVPVAELAAAVGLHVTTARVHLRLLEGAGLVVRRPLSPSGRGRPRHYYAPVPGEPTVEGHRQLAALLAGALGSDGEHGRRRAEEAGHRWAEGQVPDADDLSWDQATAAVDELFSRLGFAPRRVDGGRAGYRLALERCPFRDVARAHPEVVCTLHLGLLRGALARSGLPPEAARLEPFVAPEICVAEILRPGGPTRRRDAADPTAAE